MIQLTGTVASSGSYLVTGTAVNTQTNALLKIAFENMTAGTTLGLYVGTMAEFTSGTGGTLLSDSGGPGFVFLTITDTQNLNGNVLFVRRVTGTANSQFSLTVE